MKYMHFTIAESVKHYGDIWTAQPRPDRPMLHLVMYVYAHTNIHI